MNTYLAERPRLTSPPPRPHTQAEAVKKRYREEGEERTTETHREKILFWHAKADGGKGKGKREKGVGAWERNLEIEEGRKCLALLSGTRKREGGGEGGIPGRNLSRLVSFNLLVLSPADPKPRLRGLRLFSVI